MDALCKRYEIDNTQRSLHGALLDAEILADVYLAMTSGQSSFSLREEQSRVARTNKNMLKADPNRPSLPVLKATKKELEVHRKRMQEIEAESEQGCLWLDIDSEKRAG